MRSHGSAAVLAYNYLFPYLEGNLALADFEFELGSGQGLAALQANLQKIAAELNGGCLQRYDFYFLHKTFLMHGDTAFEPGGSW